MLESTADAINIIGNFLGIRDISALTQEALFNKYQIKQVDVLVLFGGSILEGGNVLAQAIREKIAKKYIIVGGAGHTTETLRQKMKDEFPQLNSIGLTEAEVFSTFLKVKYNLSVDYLEQKSTNCGNNITLLLELLKENKITCKSIILMQDATMQRRMGEGLKKYVKDEMLIIQYATYHVKVMQAEALMYENTVWGMWEIERYISLLLGEIPRLMDDESGYGPKGKDYIAHVDIPDEVQEAFLYLKARYGKLVREANPLYATSVL